MVTFKKGHFRLNIDEYIVKMGFSPQRKENLLEVRVKPDLFLCCLYAVG